MVRKAVHRAARAEQQEAKVEQVTLLVLKAGSLEQADRLEQADLTNNLELLALVTKADLSLERKVAQVDHKVAQVDHKAEQADRRAEQAVHKAELAERAVLRVVPADHRAEQADNLVLLEHPVLQVLECLALQEHLVLLEQEQAQLVLLEQPVHLVANLHHGAKT